MNNLNNNQGSNNRYIVSSAIGDVNGEGIPDNVFLTGIKLPDSPFTQKITLNIQNGVTGQIKSTHLKSDSGYEPTVTLWDFTGNGVYNILVGIASGGSGATMYYYIYDDYGNNLQLIFDYEVFNEIFKFKITYKDNYKVEVISEVNKTKYIIDISLRGKDYLNEIYDKNGKLKQPIEGFINPISGLYPVDLDSDGVYELQAFQKIAGQYNADSLGYVQSYLEWDGHRFVLSNQYVAIFGTEI